MNRPTTFRELPPRVQALLIMAAADSNCTPAEILGTSRQHHIVVARRTVVKRCRELTPQPSMEVIGRWLNLHHTTVLYALRQP